METIIKRESIPFTGAGLTAAAAALLLLLPPEETLGPVIKLVFLHGALVAVGLIAFGVAGGLGLATLIGADERWHRWCRAAQKTALIIWVIYALSSVIVTYLAWGVAIAWNEPRVRASAQVLGASVGLLSLTAWVDERRFTGSANVIMAGLAWWLIQSAASVRHPLNPIGRSESMAFKLAFAALVGLLLLNAVQLARWLYGREERSCDEWEG